MAPSNPTMPEGSLTEAASYIGEGHAAQQELPVTSETTPTLAGDDTGFVMPEVAVICPTHCKQSVHWVHI